MEQAEPAQPPKRKQRTEEERGSSRAVPPKQPDSSSDDDDEELNELREQQRLSRLKGSSLKGAVPASDGTATSSAGSAYNADVLFRKRPAPAAAGKSNTPVVNNNLLTSKAHSAFMKAYFK